MLSFNLYIHTDCIGTVLMVQKQQSAGTLVQIQGDIGGWSIIISFSATHPQYIHTQTLKSNFIQECTSEAGKWCSFY